MFLLTSEFIYYLEDRIFIIALIINRHDHLSLKRVPMFQSANWVISLDFKTPVVLELLQGPRQNSLLYVFV